MAIAPNSRYLRLVCMKCGWSQVITQLSDALLVSDRCARCGDGSLQSEPISALEYAMRKIFN